MWMAPPSGLRLTNAATTPSVSFVTSSRTRAEAAPWPPLMARNALVIAMVILDGSNATTDPLRRMTLYCEKRGSELLLTGLPGSPTIRSRGGAVDAVGEGALAICMGWFSCSFLVVVSCSDAFPRRTAVCSAFGYRGPSSAEFRGTAQLPCCGLAPWRGARPSGSIGICLQIRIYYILCSSGDSTPSIVGRSNRRKVFLCTGGGRRNDRQYRLLRAYRRDIQGQSTGYPPLRPPHSAADERRSPRCRICDSRPVLQRS